MKTRQQGGTLLGIIIGLVIGLGVALGVAVMINKTPLPFLDKSGRQGKFDVAPNQIIDPNKSLYGNKSAAREAAKELMKEKEPEPPVNTVAQQPEPKPPVADETGEKTKKPEPKAAEIKLGDTAKDGGKDAAAKTEDDKFTYYLQTGAFREQNDADAMRAKLALIGVEAKVSERQSENGMLYRVRVGPLNKLDAVNKVRSKLSDNSIDAAVVRIAKQ